MLSTRRITSRLHGAVSCSIRHQTTLPVPSYSVVKFEKEDVGKVMTELPEFNFYEMKESVANPYKGSTLDQSILIDAPAPKVVPHKLECSKLENGLRIATVDKQGLTAHVALYVNAGSRFETPANFGVSHMASLMAYKSTAHLSHLRTVKTLEQLGANDTATCKAGREEIVYSVDVMREFVPLVVPLVIGNVLFPRLLPWEVKAMHAKVKEARKALESDPDAMVSELLHKAAFCNNTLGLSPLAGERSMSYFTPETIRNFMLEHYAPERMVLVGINVSNEELSKWAMRSFADYNAIPMKSREEARAVYTGGDLRIEGSSPFCHLAIGFESEPWGAQDLAPVTLLQTILGGGSATQTSIGSGSSSRLSTGVIQQSPYVESCAAFNTSYSDSGLFGVYGVCQAEHAGAMADSITSNLAGLRDVTDDELRRAKAIVKGKLARQTDDGRTLMQDLGQQLLLSGAYGGSADFAAIIDGVTVDEVTAAASKLLQSKPTVAAYGDIHAVPHHAAIEAALN